MTWWKKLQRRSRLERDLSDELDFHRAMRAGDPNAPAFGNETQIRETTRDLWRLGWLESTWHDVRYALRALRRQPGFTGVVVLTLALGIGANTAVFSVVNGVLLRPLPYPEPDELESVTSAFVSLDIEGFPLSLPELLELREYSSTLASAGAYTIGSTTLGSSEPTRQTQALVTPDLLTTLGRPPLMGRSFDIADADPGAAPVALLSYGLWRQAFGGDPSVLGRRIDLDDVPTAVVGVMPPDFDIPNQGVNVWRPLTIPPDALTANRGGHNFRVIARRRAGVSHEQAVADLDRLVARWVDLAAGPHAPGLPGHAVTMAPLRDELVRDVRAVLWILQAAVGVVLLIACVNLANLLIARADSRAQEHALRAALGASRGRLLRHLTTEGLVMAALSAVGGLGLARAGLALLAAYPEAIPRLASVTIDWRVLGFTAALSVAVAWVFGLVPFVHLSRDRVGLMLRQSGHRSTAGRGPTRVRSALIVCEVALAVLLVAGAGLLVRSFVNLTRVDLGFDRAGLSTFTLALPAVTYDPAARVRFFDGLVADLEQIPGVDRAAAMTGLPPARGMNANDTNFAHIPDDRPPGTLPVENVDYYQIVSLGYTETMGIPIVGGRTFEALDLTGPPVALVNGALVRRFFEDREPIGGQLRPSGPADAPWFTVVGVVGDIKQGGVAADVGPEVYFLIDQRLRVSGQAATAMHVAVRSALPLETLASDFRRIVAGLDPSIAVTNMRTMDETIGMSITRQRFVTLLFALLAGLALFLAAIGIYGILAYLVSERRQEIGIRMAVGASRLTIVRLVLRRGLGATLVGLAVGLAAARSLTTVLTSELFEVAPDDPATLAVVCAAILVIATAACVVPAWRASRVDPMTAVRS